MAEKKRVGFYKLVADDERKRMVGALLVTDDVGKPEEFRVTYPVRPNLIQRQLYGESLFPHVGMELCGLPLVESLRNQPQLLIVSHPEFLPLGDAITSPVVYLARAGATLAVKEVGPGSRTQHETMQSISGRFDPIHVTYPSSYREDRRSQAAPLVADLFNGMDLLEPFGRIDVALSVLQQQDEKFR